MRATQTTTYRSLQAFLDRTSDKLASLQLQAATGKRMNRPSDDPTAISPVLSARTQIKASDRYIETIATGLDRVDNADGYLDGLENTMVRLKEINVATVNGALSDVDMETFADEVHQLRASLIDGANAQVDGKYLFAGFAEKTEPFTLNPAYDPDLYDEADSSTYPVLYGGDSGQVEYEIAPNELIKVNALGNEFMMGDFDHNGTIDSGSQDIFVLITQLEEALRAGKSPQLAETTTPYSPGPPAVAEEQELDFSAIHLAPGRSLTLNIDGSDYTYTNTTGATQSDDILASAVAGLTVPGYSLISSAAPATLTLSQTAGNESDIAPISLTNNTLEDLMNPLEKAADQIRSQRSFSGNVGKRLETASSHMEQIKIYGGISLPF
jgi:flagellar hook-associated protein 3 FlgL